MNQAGFRPFCSLYNILFVHNTRYIGALKNRIHALQKNASFDKIIN